MTKDEAMKLALEALLAYRSFEEYKPTYASEAIDALRQALEQPEQEPVAWLDVFTDEAYSNSEIDEEAKADLTPLYLYGHPPKIWQGLTDEEIAEGAKQSWVDKQAFESAVWWAEAKLKEKNT